MSAQLQFFRVFLTTTLALTLVFIYHSWHKRDKRGAKPLLLTFVGATVWLCADLIQVLTPADATPPIGVQLRILGPQILVTGFWLLALEYTGREQYMHRGLYGFLLILPTVTLVVFVTGLWQLFLTFETPGAVIEGYEIVLTPFYVVHLSYSWALVILSLGLLMRMMIKARYGYQRQLLALCLAFFIPFVLNILVHLNFVRYDLTTTGFFATASLMMYSTFKLRLLDTLPIARKTVLEEMDELVILLDENGDIETLNDAAKQLFGTADELQGRHISAILGEEIDIDEGTEQHAVDVRATIDGRQCDLVVDRSVLTDYETRSVSPKCISTSPKRVAIPRISRRSAKRLHAWTK